MPVLNIDFYPTFLATAGAKSPTSPLDGENLTPLFKGGTWLNRQSIFWHFPGYLDCPVPRGRDAVFRTLPVTVIRKGDWKLHFYHEEWQLDGGREKIATNNAVELYHLVTDPGETTNVALSRTQERDEILDDLLAWIQRVPATLPEEVNPAWRADATLKAAKKKSKKKAQ